MCGICGIVDFKTQPEFSTIAAMVETIRHRGPDFQNVYQNGPVALAHARLSIIDLLPTGNQPMQSRDGRYTIIFNGEIYNYRELRSKLQSEGIDFKSSSDTEVLLQAMINWGKTAISLFNGIFSFALWDNTKEEILLVRDRFGVKPLYYSVDSGGLVFGSEIKSILKSKRYNPQYSVESLHEFIYFGSALGRNTMFENVNKLLPGHLLVFNKSGLHIDAFYQLENITVQNDKFETVIEKTRYHLEMSVKRQLVSDVPVGILLSGGIDSSCITAFASKNSSYRLKTYSVGFDYDNGAKDELSKAKIIAERFGTEHNELRITGVDLSSVIEQLVYQHDEPFSDAANIPLFLLTRELKGTVKVVLQGDGGDELFAGYRRYNLLAYESFWKLLAKFRNLIKLIKLENSMRSRLLRIIDIFGINEASERMANLLTIDNESSNPLRILRSNIRNVIQNTDAFKRYREMNNRFGKFDSVQKMLLTDMSIILPDIFLEKVDKSTMANGIEARVPFLDNDLTDYVIGLPSVMKIRFGQKKYLLRHSLRGIIPDSILDAPKTGFGVPYGYWLRSTLADYAKDTLWTYMARKESLLETKVVEQLFTEHKNREKDNGFILWKTLHLALWHSKYFL